MVLILPNRENVQQDTIEGLTVERSDLPSHVARIQSASEATPFLSNPAYNAVVFESTLFNQYDSLPKEVREWFEKCELSVDTRYGTGKVTPEEAEGILREALAAAEWPGGFEDVKDLWIKEMVDLSRFTAEYTNEPNVHVILNTGFGGGKRWHVDKGVIVTTVGYDGPGTDFVDEAEVKFSEYGRPTPNEDAHVYRTPARMICIGRGNRASHPEGGPGEEGDPLPPDVGSAVTNTSGEHGLVHRGPSGDDPENPFTHRIVFIAFTDLPTTINKKA